MRSMLSLHGKTAVIALLPLLIWGVYHSMNNGEVTERYVEIGVEHVEPAQVRLTRSVGGSVHLVDIANEGADPVYVSIPESWERGEVRNVPLASLVADNPSFGYRRWTLPSHAIVTFHPEADWNNLAVHNAGSTLLQMKIITVDLQSNTTDTDTYLIQDDPLTVHF